jgi:hypothetical protein
MDQTIRNKLRNVVTQCRKLLEESIAHQLQGKYDIYATGKKDEVRAEDDVPLGHLSDEERQARQDILAHFKHIDSLAHKPKESLEQLIREIAFTHLNRLCAYKMMEVRDVYVSGQRFREAVSKGLKSQGFLFYLADHPDDEQRYNAGDQETAYRHFLNWLGGTLSQEIGVLFSPADPANRVYPPQRVLDEVLDLLNSEELKGIWSEDETIGWVYQYFTPKELRDQARKESQAPRNSYELAFRNQFFTPRYVVEFLTDNTLGRIWYEMRKGDTRLKDECRYMVRRPGDVFFSDKEDELDSPVRAMKDLVLNGTEETFSEFRVGDIQPLIELAHTVDGYERHPLENASDPNWWPWATSRQIERSEDLSSFSTQDLLDVLFIHVRGHRMTGGYGDLEPVCYRVGNEVRRRCLEGRKEDATQEQLLRAITAIPNRPNKDPREIKILDPACGSGHFLLYCFALLLNIYEEAYDDPNLRPGLQADYPTKDDLRRSVPGLILRHNLHGIDIDLRCTQIAALALWLRCQRAYQEMGFKKDRSRITKANIVCAEPMPGEKDMLKEFVGQLEPKLLGQLVEVVFDKMKLAGEAGSLLKVADDIRDAVSEARRQWRIGPVATQLRLFGEPKPVQRQEKFDFSGISDAQFFEQAEARVVDGLRNYAEQAQSGQRVQRRLFSDDAVRGFAFMDLCHKRFDVVLMNPPFGEPSKLGKGYIERDYPRTKNDLYAAFVELGLRRLQPGGLLGAITSRSGFFLTSFHRWREILLSEVEPTVFADLGFGVLDTAKVEAAAYCIAKASQSGPKSTFIRLLSISGKQEALENAVEQLSHGQADALLYAAKPASFRALPEAQFAYWVSERTIRLFRDLPTFERDGRDARGGLKTGDNFRFVRAWWEIAPESIVHGSKCTTPESFRKQTKEGSRWVPFAKGGEYSPIYCDLHLVVDWKDDGAQSWELYRIFREQLGGIVRNPEYYFLPGLTWSRRPWLRGAFSIVPAGVIFSDTGMMLFLPLEDLWSTCALLNTDAFIGLLHLLMARGGGSETDQTLQYEIGYVTAVPIPEMTGVDREALESLAKESFNLYWLLDTVNETSHAFFRPVLMRASGESILSTFQAWEEWRSRLKARLVEIHTAINEIVYRTYGIHGVQRVAIEQGVGRPVIESSSSFNHTDDDPDTFRSEDDHRRALLGLLSFAVGSVLGRWDITGFVEADQDRRDPIDPLPVCSPGMLQGPDGLSATQTPDGYPLCIDWDGTLVDDPDHPDDILRRVRDALEVIWKYRADAMEREACEVLGVIDLRDYFRKPGAGGFWDNHIKRYSKSRRKAPIYWLLQSSKKNYALWIYYHRLDKDILFKALLNYVEPKLRREEARLDELRSQKTAIGGAAKGSKKLDKDIDRQDVFLTELRDFEDKLRRVANLHLEPDLNDGVILNIAPLRELVPWKEAKSYWDDLMDGKYEWSSIGKQLREKGLVK